MPEPRWERGRLRAHAFRGTNALPPQLWARSRDREQDGLACPNSKAPPPGTSCRRPWAHRSLPFQRGVSLRRSPVASEDLRASLTEWARRDNEGTPCMSIAVQHTLYYHAAQKFHRLAMDRLDGDPVAGSARALHAGALERHTQGLYSVPRRRPLAPVRLPGERMWLRRDKERRQRAAAGRDISTTKKAPEGRHWRTRAFLQKGQSSPRRAVRGRLHRSHHAAGTICWSQEDYDRHRPDEAALNLLAWSTWPRCTRRALRDALRGPGGEQAYTLHRGASETDSMARHLIRR
ncbi:hypothetical protein Q5P01_000665 [Channa striata]|uniref:Uncharacterized protein n=1 Tax=Channa striata TaxID=64152 RepID=A0AA88IKT1_CHASR|nr:hypothetical protein Q5P01_000665 [Channa striata]